jgi:hypothetical protein
VTTALVRSRFHVILIGLAVLVAGTAAVIGVVWYEVVHTSAVRGSVQSYTRLIAAANRQDLDAVRRLCSGRYLRTHALESAGEGGVAGLPRNIDKNFQVWRHGQDVWLCPTNRVGPVFQFVFESGGWKFDGPVGLLQPGGRVEPFEDRSQAPAPVELHETGPWVRSAHRAEVSGSLPLQPSQSSRHVVGFVRRFQPRGSGSLAQDRDFDDVSCTWGITSGWHLPSIRKSRME